MPGKKNNEYLIDVAAKHKYRNQSKEYQETYHRWRNDPSNPYGYSFVHDSRIRTYVDGEGFYEETADVNERRALQNCYRLTGVTMLIMIAVVLVKYTVLDLAFGVRYAGRTYYSDLNSVARGISDSAAYALLALNLLEYLLPIAFLKAATRMPSKIAVPLKKSKVSMTNSVMMMLVIMSIGRLYNSFCAYILNLGKIDMPYFDYIRAESPTALVICGIGQHVILPILIEIVYRGYFLQLFRQFGDNFAVIITSAFSCFMLYDIAQMGYTFCVGIFTGIITIRSGTIKNACIMRMIARGATYLMTFMSGITGEFGTQVIQLSFSLVIFICSMFVYVRINTNRRWSFETGNSGSSLTTGEKIRLLFLSPFFWAWIVTAFVVSLMMVKTL